MKSLKILGAVLGVASLSMVLLGSGTASATVLCKEAKNPCGASAYASGTEFKTELWSGTNFVWRDPSGLWADECSGNTLVGKVGNAGTLTERVTIPLSSASWTGCAHSRTILSPGKLEVNYEFGLPYATFTWKELEWSDDEIFRTCRFGTGQNGAVGPGRLESSVNSSSPASLLFEFKVPKVASFGCSEYREILAEIHITAPTPLYVEPS